jgi:hypothetical protein
MQKIVNGTKRERNADVGHGHAADGCRLA